MAFRFVKVSHTALYMSKCCALHTTTNRGYAIEIIIRKLFIICIVQTSLSLIWTTKTEMCATVCVCVDWRQDNEVVEVEEQGDEEAIVSLQSMSFELSVAMFRYMRESTSHGASPVQCRLVSCDGMGKWKMSWMRNIVLELCANCSNPNARRWNGTEEWKRKRDQFQLCYRMNTMVST